MTNTTTKSSPKPEKPKVGDLVVFRIEEGNTNKISYKLQAEPLHVMHDMQELANPKIVMMDTSYFEVPQDPGCWVVIKERDLFTPRGYMVRIVKISNIVTGSSGWISEKSIRFPTENDDLSRAVLGDDE